MFKKITYHCDFFNRTMTFTASLKVMDVWTSNYGLDRREGQIPKAAAFCQEYFEQMANDNIFKRPPLVNNRILSGLVHFLVVPNAHLLCNIVLKKELVKYTRFQQTCQDVNGLRPLFQPKKDHFSNSWRTQRRKFVIILLRTG